VERTSKESKESPKIPDNLDSSGLGFAIVASRFNANIVDRLLEGALEALEKTGTPPHEVRVVRVPGSFELPVAAKRLTTDGAFDAVIALGCVIRGETPHFEHVGRAATEGLLRVSLDANIPVTFGVLTTENYEQAAARSGGDAGNRGFDAAIAAIEMVRLLRDL
jgi:6,7-dimethyl-8-ribityllumazine synthase